MADDSYNRTYRTSERPAREPSAPAPEPPPDPLVELARLIGQNDPFAYDAGGSARREPRKDIPVAREEPPASRMPDLPPIPRWSAPGRAEAPSAPRFDDRFAPRGAPDPSPPSWPPQADDRRRHAAFDEPLQQVEEPLPKSYSEPMYPRAEEYPGADEYKRGAEPRGYDRFAPAEHAWPEPDHADDQAYAAKEPAYPARNQGYPDHADAPDEGAYQQDDPRYAAIGRHDDEATRDGAFEPGGYAGEPRGRYYDEDESDSDYDERRPDRRRNLLMVAAVLALAIFGTAGAYGFRSMGGKATTPSAPPVIKADNTPNKIASASQSGDANKQIYERLGGQGERMVSREEQPVDTRGLVPGVAPAFPDGPVGAPAAIPVAPAPRAGAAPAAPSQPGEPKKIRTVTIKPDQQGAAAPAQRTPSRPANAPLSLNPQGGAPAEAAPAPARGPQTALAAPPPRASESGNYVVQLSAQKSESEAQASFRAMQTKYASVLGGQKPLIRKKDLGAKGVYYGAQVGPFASREEAARLCESLKSAGGTCIVQKN